MKTIYDRPLTLDELVDIAKKRRQQFYRDHARHLCSALRIAPEDRWMGPYLHKDRCEDNLDATVRWLKGYLGDEDILEYNFAQDDCVCAFRTELCKRIPPNYWGEET